MDRATWYKMTESERASVRENMCTCELDDVEPHACPYQEEINDGQDSEYCTCCEYCTQRCMWEI